MTFNIFTIRKIGLLLLSVMALFSCESNFKEVQKQNFSEFAPTGEADDFNMKSVSYTHLRAHETN
jgi:hypothetical protein